tara:strand:+ start:711 stop:1790 length:1080 start_codon:yes stop_codon:yes gene_type:complete
MSLPINTLAEALQAVRVDLETNVNDPSNYGKMTGTLNWLFSAQNPNTIETIMNQASSNGKYKPVQISYLPKKGTNDVISAATGLNCDSTVTRRELVNTYNPSLFVGDKFTISESIVREGTLEQVSQRMAIELRDAMRNCREQMNTGIFTAASTVIGSNPAAGTNKGAYTTINLLNSDTTVSADAFDDLKIHQEDNYMTGDMGLVGLGKARKYFNRLAVGSASDGGVDINKVFEQYGMVLFKDSDTTDVLGNADRILAMYPGLAQFYSYNFYDNTDAAHSIAGDIMKTTITDPVYPQIKYDYKLKYDDGCATGNGKQGAWVGTISLDYDLWTVPEEAFGELYADNLTDFNGIVGYLVTQS